jgi:UDP-glucose 4-epimerase
VETIRGDITDDETLKDAVKDIHIVFHLAAKLHGINPSSSLYADYRRVNVKGTRQLVAAAKSAGVSRMIYFSTINVYGHSDLKKINNENSPVKPTSIYAKTKAEAEKIVLSEMPSVVLRLAAVYGSRMKGNYQRLLAALKNRYFIMVGVGQNRRTLVYIQDVCQAAILAAGHIAALGQVYNVTDGEIHTFQEVVTVMCSALGRDYPKFRISEYPVRRILGFIEDAFTLFGQKAPIGRFTVDKLIEDLAVSGDRITKELGYQPQFDLEAGWKNCIQRIR